MRYISLKISVLLASGALLLGVAVPGCRAADEGAGDTGASSEIIGKYLQATHLQGNALPGASMEVDINASVPKLKERGRLHALRVISQVGRISYRVLGFQGSNTVKSQVIARYLQAEQQGQGDPRLAIAPENYKFRFRGVRNIGGTEDVYIFALSPRASRPGLFKGEMWLDARTCLPLYEKGRLVKNPSIFFKKVDFERAFAIQNGTLVPAHMNSTIRTRLVGTVELDVNYTNYAQKPGEEAVGGTPASFVTRSFR